MARPVANAKWHRPRHRASAQCWESSGRDRSPQHWGAATAFVIHQRNGWQTSPQGWRGRGCRAAQGHRQLWEGCVCTPLGVPGGGRLQLFKIKRSLKWILVADGRSLVDKLHSSVFPSELLLTLTSVHRDSRVASSEGPPEARCLLHQLALAMYWVLVGANTPCHSPDTGDRTQK